MAIIEEFIKAGGSLFIDGCTGITDKDLACIADNCRILLDRRKENSDEKVHCSNR